MNDSRLVRQESLGYQVNHLARLLAHALHERIEPHGVVPGQFAQLLVLYEQDDLTQAELCERASIEQPTMANTLKRMERDGLIERLPDPDDGRRARVRLTARAHELRPTMEAAAREINAAASVGLSDEQVDAVMAAMARMIHNLERGEDHSGG